MGSACLSLMAVCLRLQLGIPTVVCCAAGMLLADDGAGGLIYIAVALAVASWPLVSMKLWPSTYTAGFNADSTQTRC